MLTNLKHMRNIISFLTSTVYQKSRIVITSHGVSTSEWLVCQVRVLRMLRSSAHFDGCFVSGLTAFAGWREHSHAKKVRLIFATFSNK